MDSPARMMDTPQIRPSKSIPLYGTPVGVETVLSTTGRWLRPEIDCYEYD